MILTVHLNWSDQMIKQFRSLLMDNQKNVIFASSIFFISLFLGIVLFDQNSQYFYDVFAQLKDIANQIKTRDSVVYMVFTIFFNNLFITFLMITFGIFFGIIPIIILISNGMIIGFLVKVLIESGQTIGFILLGILPHGLLELPTVIIAAAFGMKLGFVLFQLLLNLLGGKDTKHKQTYLWDTIKQIPVVFLGLIILLFAAAVIESTLTGYLLTKFYIS